MDARERLRRYLEQRRELGESEFVLDGMPVEDVLKLVGARTAGRRGSARADTAPPTPASAPRTGGASDAPDAPYAPHAPLDNAYPAGDHDAPEALRPVDAPPLPPPPAPDVRFDRGASTDWRATLRNAGAMVPPGAGAGAGASDASAPSASGTPASAPPPPVHATSTSTPRAVLPPWLEALGVPAGLEAGAVAVRDLLPEVAALPTLEQVAEHIAACQRCALYKTARHPVPGEGHPQAELLCVGEAPGANEDMQGRPFVGDAGQLLTKILAAIQLGREDVFIHNVLKHRPPGNRDPLPDEVHACQPYLLRQIELVRPRVILALGRFAAQTLLQTTTGIGALRGQIHRFHGVPLVVTYHPAALLRNEAWKRPTWEDVKLARRVLDAARVAEPTRSSE